MDALGSIEVGKVADFAVLTGNPLTVAPDRIESIGVAETIKDGVTVWRLPEKDAAR